MSGLEKRIHYQFKNEMLLKEALTHSSFGYEHHCLFNERFEFLGDSVLGYVISRELFLKFPKEPEGVLSKMKSVLVSAPTLAKKANELGLGRELMLGKGEKRAGGHKKPSILADAMEALIGAIVLDGGLECADRFICELFANDVATASLELKNSVDFKTLLQEKLQEIGLGLPNYQVVREEGPAHNRKFHVSVSVGDHSGSVAIGTSKKNAQQECAKLLLNDTEFWEKSQATCD